VILFYSLSAGRFASCCASPPATGLLTTAALWSVLVQYLLKDLKACRLEKCDADCVAASSPWDTVIKLVMHRNWSLDWPATGCY
jgi:hypothetical protein